MFSTDPNQVTCLGMQFDAMLAYNELLASRPWTADLAAIAKDHELLAVLATRKGGHSAPFPARSRSSLDDRRRFSSVRNRRWCHCGERFPQAVPQR
jgi:hypothetical protein